jgi:hypothetical protein
MSSDVVMTLSVGIVLTTSDELTADLFGVSVVVISFAEEVVWVTFDESAEVFCEAVDEISLERITGVFSAVTVELGVVEVEGKRDDAVINDRVEGRDGESKVVMLVVWTAVEFKIGLVKEGALTVTKSKVLDKGVDLENVGYGIFDDVSLVDSNEVADDPDVSGLASVDGIFDELVSGVNVNELFISDAFLDPVLVIISLSEVAGTSDVGDTLINGTVIEVDGSVVPDVTGTVDDSDVGSNSSVIVTVVDGVFCWVVNVAIVVEVLSATVWTGTVLTFGAVPGSGVAFTSVLEGVFTALCDGLFCNEVGVVWLIISVAVVVEMSVDITGDAAWVGVFVVCVGNTADDVSLITLCVDQLSEVGDDSVVLGDFVVAFNVVEVLTCGAIVKLAIAVVSWTVLGLSESIVRLLASPSVATVVVILAADVCNSVVEVLTTASVVGTVTSSLIVVVSICTTLDLSVLIAVFGDVL